MTSRLLLRFTESASTIGNDRFSIDADFIKPGRTTFTLNDLPYPILSVEVEGDLTILTLIGAPRPEHALLANGYAEAELPDGNMLAIEFGSGEVVAQFREVSEASRAASEDRRRLQKSVVNPGGMHCVCKCGCRKPSGIMLHCLLCRAGSHLPAMPDSRGL